MSSKNKKGPWMTDPSMYLQAGIDPKTKKPIRMMPENALRKGLYNKFEKLDLKNSINRFTWYNLPGKLTGELLERMLYYKGQAMFFYMEMVDEFYILPYTLYGTIDVYGDYINITPVPFNGTSDDGGETPWILDYHKKVIDELPIDLENLKKAFFDGAVILRDESRSISQVNIANSISAQPILEEMSKVFPMASTALLANSGIKGILVNSDDEYQNVQDASAQVKYAALNQDPWIPITATVGMQDLTSAGSAMKAEEYLLYLQSLDNLRLSFYGLKNGGLFQKKSHLLEAEQDNQNGTVGLILEDSLRQRQEFCDMVNAIWGLGIWCELSESLKGVDADMDGYIGEDKEYEDTSGESTGDMSE